MPQNNKSRGEIAGPEVKRETKTPNPFSKSPYEVLGLDPEASFTNEEIAQARTAAQREWTRYPDIQVESFAGQLRARASRLIEDAATMLSVNPEVREEIKRNLAEKRLGESRERGARIEAPGYEVEAEVGNVLWSIAGKLKQKQKWDAAQAVYETIIERDPHLNKPAARAALAFVLASNGDVSDAAKMYLDYLSQNETDERLVLEATVYLQQVRK